MKIRLGYVAIALGLEKEGTTSKTMTFANFSKLSNEMAVEKLIQITLQNISNLQKVLEYNVQNHIEVYRMTSKLIPLATHPDVIWDYERIVKEPLKKIGEYIKKNKLRISSHPDQFVVINSHRDDVFQNALKELVFQYQIFEWMGIEEQAVIVLHLGGAYGDKEMAIQQLYKGFERIPVHIREKLVFENDDKTYTVKETIEVCETLKLPMVLDIHHYQCNNEGEELLKYWPRIYESWRFRKMVPKIHVSSPKTISEKGKQVDRSHADYIDIQQFLDFIEIAKRYGKNFDVMIEAKMKDLALYQLTKELEQKIYITLINSGTFLV